MRNMFGLCCHPTSQIQDSKIRNFESVKVFSKQAFPEMIIARDGIHTKIATLNVIMTLVGPWICRGNLTLLQQTIQ